MRYARNVLDIDIGFHGYIKGLDTLIYEHMFSLKELMPEIVSFLMDGLCVNRESGH